MTTNVTRFTVEIDSESAAKLKTEAKKRNRSRNNMIIHLIKKFIAQNEVQLEQ